MKTLFFFCMVAIVFSMGCSKDGEQEQNLTIEGTWGIIELTYKTSDGTQKVMETEISKGTAVTDFFFMSDGKFKQTSNMSGSGTLDTYEGTWKLTGDQLIITLQIEGQKVDVDYTYEFKNNLLVLTRTSPDGKMSIINTFRKK